MDELSGVQFSDVDPNHQVTMSQRLSGEENLQQTCDETAHIFDDSLARLRTLVRRATQDSMVRTKTGLSSALSRAASSCSAASFHFSPQNSFKTQNSRQPSGVIEDDDELDLDSQDNNSKTKDADKQGTSSRTNTPKAVILNTLGRIGSMRLSRAHSDQDLKGKNNDDDDENLVVDSSDDDDDDDVVIQRLMQMQSSKLSMAQSSSYALTFRKFNSVNTDDMSTFRSGEFTTSSDSLSPNRNSLMSTSRALSAALHNQSVNNSSNNNSNSLAPSPSLPPLTQPQHRRTQSHQEAPKPVPLVSRTATNSMLVSLTHETPRQDPLPTIADDENTNNSNDNEGAVDADKRNRDALELWKALAPELNPTEADLSSPYLSVAAQYLANPSRGGTSRHTSKIKLLVATWNLGNHMPDPAELDKWLPLEYRTMPDLVVIGVQECNYKMEGGSATNLKIERKTFRDIILRQDASPTSRRHFNTQTAAVATFLSGDPEIDNPRPPPTSGRSTKRMSDLLPKRKPNKNLSNAPTRRSNEDDDDDDDNDNDKDTTNNNDDNHDDHNDDGDHNDANDHNQDKNEPSSTNRSRNHDDAEFQVPPKLETRSKSLFGTRLERKKMKRKIVSNDKFDSMVQMHFGANYRKVASIHLKDMRLLVLCTKDLRHHITDIEKTSKATGIGNIIGNKGGLMIRMKVMDTTLCFLSCHLHAHDTEKDCQQRNEDMAEIFRGSTSSIKSGLDVSTSHDHTFVFGDLNYRVNMAIADGQSRTEKQQRDDVLLAIEKHDYAKLLAADQLGREVAAGKVLHGFVETPPTFAPTFKMLRGVSHGYKNKRVPSYCDRILHKSLPGLQTTINQLSYSSCPQVTTSDHKPVTATYELLVEKPDENSDISTPRTSSLRPTIRSLVRKFQTEKHNHHLKISEFTIKNASEGLENLQSLVFRFTGEVVNEQLVPKSVAQSARSGLSWQYVPAIPLKVTQATHLTARHLIVSVWDKPPKSGGVLLAQAAIPLGELKDAPNRPFAVPLSLFGLSCGLLVGNMTLMSDRELSGSFIRRFKKEEYVV